MPELQASIEQAAQWVAEAPAILITAGAGMGVDSGLPDFRGPQGLWKAYPALGKNNWNFREVASPQAFRLNPGLAWGFYAHRLQTYRNVQPHAGFNILWRWGRRAPNGYRVFTSNVDGHFQKAGFDPSLVAECHGSLHYMECLEGCASESWSADGFEPQFVSSQDLQLATLPVCPQCGSLARPNVLMFDDWRWVGDAYEHAVNEVAAWRNRHAAQLLVIELGAGLDIPTVRYFGERGKKRFIRINLREPNVPSSRSALGIAGKALDVLQRMDELLV